ncbi:hypothetical protein M405DRAFT_522391 [Rhizopogon salebrosus TDB-379]|nr:hypothetical protein M405DRAFT_522391 [Rhizopogon salebrosus TDB-379]
MRRNQIVSVLIPLSYICDPSPVCSHKSDGDVLLVSTVLAADAWRVSSCGCTRHPRILSNNFHPSRSTGHCWLCCARNTREVRICANQIISAWFHSQVVNLGFSHKFSKADRNTACQSIGCP